MMGSHSRECLGWELTARLAEAVSVPKSVSQMEVSEPRWHSGCDSSLCFALVIEANVALSSGKSDRGAKGHRSRLHARQNQPRIREFTFPSYAPDIFSFFSGSPR